MGYCIKCKEGHFIGNDMQCTKCDESCGTCEEKQSCSTCADNYYKGNTEGICSPFSDIDMTCYPTKTGCNSNCKPGYYAESIAQINCTACPETSNCKTCYYDEKDKTAKCKLCPNDNKKPEDTLFIKDGKCVSCKEIKGCLRCTEEGCAECEGNLEAKGAECIDRHLDIIIPVVVTAGVLIILIIIVIICIISWKKIHKKNAAKSIKPFKITSDLELSLLSADNKNFPLKTATWELNFGLDKNKALIDREYVQTVQIANTSKRGYFFEILATPSHRYELIIDPPRYTLQPGNAIDLEFKIKMLCTASVSDEIGIIAMDIEDQNKETAKITLKIESDLSLKLDHTDLQPQMPAIGEGAFGMVFRGCYRGRDIAIKKMKARNMTEEQEKEFTHEVSMLTQLRHQCVVEFIGAVYTQGEISIVTEFAEHGSLSKIWGKEKLTYDVKVKIIDDLAVALAFLHQNQIIHRDVKGENVLIYSLNPHSTVCGKLTDFGTCRNISERNRINKELTQGIGTPTYMAPECLQNFDYSYPVDVYSYGIVLYETFIEKSAYSDEQLFDQPWKIPQFVIEGKRLDQPDGMPENYWKLTQQCWDQNAENRPSFTDVLAEIESWDLDIKLAIHVDEKVGDKKVVEEETSTSSSSEE